MNFILQIPIQQRLIGLFLLGLLLGSLINWAIYQFAWSPRSISPWSKPPKDVAPRKWFDYLPLLGWFSLSRESSTHGTGFWIRPMLIEFSTGIFLMWLYSWEVQHQALLPTAFLPHFNLAESLMTNHNINTVLHSQYLVHVFLFSALMIASWIDVDEKTIPDMIVVPGTLLALLAAAIYPWSLLPSEVITLPGGGRAIDFLNFTSPSKQPWPEVIGAKPAISGLCIAIACFWFWVFALLDRTTRWFMGWRAGLVLAKKNLLRSMKDPAIKIIFVAGTTSIVLVWWLGGTSWVGLVSSLIGLVTGVTIVWTVRVIGSWILKKEAMGFGDVTLMGMIGAFIGWQLCIVVFFMAAVFGLIYGILQMIVNRDMELFYGPFLSLSAMVIVVRWASFWAWARPIYTFGWLVPAVLAGMFVMMAILLLIIQGIKILFLRVGVKTE